MRGDPLPYHLISCPNPGLPKPPSVGPFFLRRAWSFRKRCRINDAEGVSGQAGPVRVIRLDRRVQVVVVLQFASDVQSAIGTRITDLEHLITLSTFSPSQEPDVVRILPSGWRSITIAMRSDVASFSSIFSRFSTRIIVPSPRCSGVTETAGPLATGVASLNLAMKSMPTSRRTVTAPSASRPEMRDLFYDNHHWA